MTKEEIQALYKKLILPESKNPYHFDAKNETCESELAYNPMCGDKYSLFLNEESGKLNTAHFHGFGCAVSKASTSILIKRLEGMELEKAKDLCFNFMQSFDQGNLDHLDDEMRVLVELKNFDGRLDCIQLSWKALLDHLNKHSI